MFGMNTFFRAISRPGQWKWRRREKYRISFSFFPYLCLYTWLLPLLLAMWITYKFNKTIYDRAEISWRQRWGEALSWAYLSRVWKTGKRKSVSGRERSVFFGLMVGGMNCYENEKKVRIKTGKQWKARSHSLIPHQHSCSLVSLFLFMHALLCVVSC